MRSNLPFIAWSTLVALALVVCSVAAWQLWRPYGHREAFFRSVDSALQNSASHHDGAFPDGRDPYKALQSLFPDYVNPGYELAGLSGNIKGVASALLAGQSISNLTSWVYVPGLRTNDDPRIAILWESKAGFHPSGRLSFRRIRPVLLLNREITNVPVSHWEGFLKDQEKLRGAIKHD
jgi:hypothetical protein